MSEAITIQESARLVELEDIIERGVKTFIKVGEALAEIRDKKLYRVEYSTFEDYCREEWEISRIQAHRLIGAAEVVSVLPIGNKPTNEAQARPLTKLDTPEEQREAWTAAVEASDGKPTAKHVEAAVEEIKSREQEPAPEPKPKLPRYVPADGLKYAELAILNLEKIQANDTQREAAFKRVTNWITKNQ